MMILWGRIKVEKRYERMVNKRNCAEEPRVLPGVHEKFLMVGWFTNQYSKCNPEHFYELTPKHHLKLAS